MQGEVLVVWVQYKDICDSKFFNNDYTIFQSDEKNEKEQMM